MKNRLSSQVSSQSVTQLLALGRWLGHCWGLDRLRRDDGRLLGLGHGLGWGLDRLRSRDNGLLLGREACSINAQCDPAR